MITYQVGTNVEYAKPVEFGTQRQIPQPYLRPAYNIVIPEYKAALKRILRRAK
jgi:HK97 gp10 family phage protein